MDGKGSANTTQSDAMPTEERCWPAEAVPPKTRTYVSPKWVAYYSYVRTDPKFKLDYYAMEHADRVKAAPPVVPTAPTVVPAALAQPPLPGMHEIMIDGQSTKARKSREPAVFSHKPSKRPARETYVWLFKELQGMTEGDRLDLGPMPSARHCSRTSSAIYAWYSSHKRLCRCYVRDLEGNNPAEDFVGPTMLYVIDRGPWPEGYVPPTHKPKADKK